MSHGTHIRETESGASELKFLVDDDLGSRIAAWARTHLPADAHGAGPHGDEYRITSLYFDTDYYDVFHGRGSFGRSKYRVRRYGSSNVMFLERKLRKPDLLHKRRTLVPLSDFARLDDPNVDQDWPGRWFHRRLVARSLRPRCELSYRRMARELEKDRGYVRLTIDDEVRARPVEAMGFHDDHSVPVLGRQKILELKYRVALPSIFTNLLEEFALTPMVASKYRLGMTALGHVALPPAQASAAQESD